MEDLALSWQLNPFLSTERGFAKKGVAADAAAASASPAAPAAYGAEQIQVLEGLDPVRKRPGMYIGSTGSRGLHHLLWEVLDNAVDEVQGGFADTVTVQVDLSTHTVTVTDNGRYAVMTVTLLKVGQVHGSCRWQR
eukprot:gene11203-11353_t